MTNGQNDRKERENEKKERERKEREKCIGDSERKGERSWNGGTTPVIDGFTTIQR